MSHTQDGIASANPDYPQEVKNVTGENSIIVSGKNLFKNTDITKYHSNNGAITSIETGIKIANTATAGTNFVTIPVLDVSNYVGEKFTLKTNWTTSGGADGQVILGLCDANGGNRIAGVYGYTSGSDVTYTIPTLSTSTYLACWFYCNTTGSVAIGDAVEYENLQIEKGESSTPYEAYRTPTTYTIDLGTLELVKLEDNKDKLYKSNGNWYKHAVIGKSIYTGSENWQLYSESGSQPRRLAVQEVDKWTDDSMPMVADRFTCGLKNSQNDLEMWTQLKYLVITDKNSKWANATALKTWLGLNPTTVYYPITATNIEITNATLISQLEAIHLATGTNVIGFSGDTLVSGIDINYIGEASPHL